MTMPSTGGPAADPPDHPTGWLVLTASERGAAHVAVKTPNQDSVAVERAGASGVVTAVADGHGHSRHLRSATGSKFAVSIGCRVGQELADKLAAGRLDEPATAPAEADAQAQQITDLAETFLVPTVVARWREAVLADVEADPFTDAEQDKRRRGDDPTIAYGSTLLLCVALGDWLALAQIGDGDVVGVRTDGTATLPIPVDPQLDGLVTTSLCGPQATSDFRVAVVNATRTPLLAVLLATDGYGNAQVVEEWPSSFSQDLAWLLRQRDVRWLASQLPAWAARCASADGSADDTTVALLISSAGQAEHESTLPRGASEAPATEPDAGSDEITIPAVIRTDTVPSGQVPSGRVLSGQGHPIEPITVQLQAGQITTEQMTTEEIAAAAAISRQITADWEPPGSSAGSSIE
jgi:serine/threonine protein phosphatase PrpC